MVEGGAAGDVGEVTVEGGAVAVEEGVVEGGT